RGRRNPWLWLLAVVALFVVVRHIGHGSLIDAVRELRSKMDNPVKGVVRFLVTPIPFHTAPGYGFMDLPQMIYFILMVLLYGSFTTLQGARHRVQIDGLVVIFQFYGILALFRQRFRQRARFVPERPPDALSSDDIDASPDIDDADGARIRAVTRAGGAP